MFIAAAAEHPRGNLWDADACDIGMATVAALPQHSPQGLFVAAPASARIDGQGNYAALLADRLGLTDCQTIEQFDSGDGSAASMLYMGYEAIRCGMLESILLLGVAKVSDLEERDRYGLLDEMLDTHAEKQLGLNYVGLSGLLADHYVRRYGIKGEDLCQITAKNHANACRGPNTYLAYAATAEELMLDIKTAYPLRRNDIAPLLDGGLALLLANAKVARQIAKQPILVEDASAGADITALADRQDMTRALSLQRALARMDSGRIKNARLIEAQNTTCVMEALIVETLGLTQAGGACNYYHQGEGLAPQAKRVVNARGGQQGTGNLYGLCALDQAFCAFEQLQNRAGDYQLEPPSGDKTTVLAIAGAGLLSRSYCFLYAGANV